VWKQVAAAAAVAADAGWLKLLRMPPGTVPDNAMDRQQLVVHSLA